MLWGMLLGRNTFGMGAFGGNDVGNKRSFRG